MNAAIRIEELIRLRFNPPSCSGLVSRSPTVAPSGRVRINADQNSSVRDRPVRKYAAATSASKAVKNSAPPSYPRPEIVRQEIAERGA